MSLACHWSESLSKDDPIPSSLSGDLFLPALPFLLSIIFLKQFSAVNISVFFSEPIAHFSTAIRPHPEQKTTKKELNVIPPQKRPS
jgi:hypothetical protein